MRWECCAILLEQFCAEAGLSVGYIRSNDKQPECIQITSGPSGAVVDSLPVSEFIRIVTDFEKRVAYIAEVIAYSYPSDRSELHNDLRRLGSFITFRYGCEQSDVIRMVWNPANAIMGGTIVLSD